jgi:uncharacterized protein (TIGR03437 family)
MNSASNPAPLGSIVSIWATGLGHESGVDGTIYSGPAVIGVSVSGVSVVTTDGSLDVLFEGDAPSGVLGLSQVNFRLPQSPQTGNGTIAFMLQTPTAASDGVSIHTVPEP